MKNQQKLRFRKAEVIGMRWVAVCAIIGSMSLLSKDPDRVKLMTIVGCITLLILVLLWAIWEISFWLFKQRHAFILGDVVSKYLTLQQMDHLDEIIISWCTFNSVTEREEKKLRRCIKKSYKNVCNTKDGYSLTINMLGFPVSSTIGMKEIKIEYDNASIQACVKFSTGDELHSEESNICFRG